MAYEITITGTPKTWNSFIGRQAWAYYSYAKTIKEQIAYSREIKGIPRRMSSVRITVDVGYTTKRRNDICDLCTKPHMDALVQNEIIQDDNRQILRVFSVVWHEAKEPETKIIIEEISTSPQVFP